MSKYVENNTIEINAFLASSVIPKTIKKSLEKIVENVSKKCPLILRGNIRLQYCKIYINDYRTYKPVRDVPNLIKDDLVRHYTSPK